MVTYREGRSICCRGDRRALQWQHCLLQLHILRQADSHTYLKEAEGNRVPRKNGLAIEDGRKWKLFGPVTPRHFQKDELRSPNSVQTKEHAVNSTLPDHHTIHSKTVHTIRITASL
jgi:hypothetical protein